MSGISIVGGGIAGLVAGITCAEAEVEATIFEGHDDLGGRARSSEGPTGRTSARTSSTRTGRSADGSAIGT